MTMIKIETIKDPMAEGVWQTRGRDGTIVSRKIVFGKPQRIHETPNSDWYCPVMTEDFMPKITPVTGVCSDDSIANAMKLVSTFINKCKDDLVDCEQN